MRGKRTPVRSQQHFTQEYSNAARPVHRGWTGRAHDAGCPLGREESNLQPLD